MVSIDSTGRSKTLTEYAIRNVGIGDGHVAFRQRFSKERFLVAGVVLVARVSHRTVMDMRRRFYRDSLLMDQKRIDRIGTSNLMTMLTHNMNMVSGGADCVLRQEHS